jgi:hypothetical protein
MVTAGGKPIPKEEAVCDMVQQFYRATYRPSKSSSLQEVWETLQLLGVSGMGSFIAAQVVADLKFDPVLLGAGDWMTFCAPGPGSQIGLNRLLDQPLTRQWNQDEFQQEINLLRERVKIPESAQDMQNCLCEFSKYQRGFCRSKYPGGVK